MTARIRTAVLVEGIVQGVGFRPFVYGLATRLGLAGLVGNDADGVFAEIEGDPAAVARFLAALEQQAPPLARIDKITTRELAPAGSSGFVIAPSPAAGPSRRALVSADTATCADCLAELADPGDRRHDYPFINCTNCGPRFTIVTDVPYDRAATTMAGFAMCAACAAEYHDPADRRFHAQPTCCPACGPRLQLVTGDGVPVAAVPQTARPARGGTRPPEAGPVAAAAALLRAGQVLAVKGLGGYHLAADAGSAAAAAALRARKHREDKPFAIMVADVAAARQLCEVSDPAAALLASARRPIVLLPRRAAAAAGPPAIAPAVAPGSRQLGVMLPYTPLHHLLLRELAGPMILTSGNVSDEPIAYADRDARQRLAGIADAYLAHDRAIHIRTDDSVVRVFRGGAAVLRRSRGYVPEPLPVPVTFTRPVLACGAELKSTFCLGARNQAFLSHHIGDLENAETLGSFTAGIDHFRQLFDIEPQVIAHDLHPDYLSTAHAARLADLLGAELVGVQHHHAHIASCLADNGERGPVIGVAFDGTGYGPDGTIWGGEFLIADLAGYRRAGHLVPVPMPGGAAAIRQPWRMAASYLAAAYPDGPAQDGAGRDGAGRDGGGAGRAGAGLAVRARNERAWGTITAMAERGINAPLTSSAGRLFDAVAALLGVRDTITYEGQAAIELEQLADPAERGCYRVAASGGEPLRVAAAGLVRAAADDLGAGVSPPVIAARFHHGVAALIEDACVTLRDRTGLDTVALSGGVFQNLLLADRVVSALTARGFRVLTHRQVPCNDGGISLGQAVIAASRGPGAPAG
ncbi:MAG TPA: carbamoyltransferase HypF [Streptosporangiaceae bacterium]|jgi:hydrogenase maturation protein HypF